MPPSQAGTLLGVVKPSSSLSTLTSGMGPTSGIGPSARRTLSRPSSQGALPAVERHQPAFLSQQPTSRGFSPGRKPPLSNFVSRGQLQQRALQHLHASRAGLASAGSSGPLVLTSREFEKIVEHADDSFVSIKQRAANINWREAADYRSPSSLATPKSLAPPDEEGHAAHANEEIRKVAFVEFRDSMPYYREDGVPAAT